MQHEIIHRIPLLDGRGELTEPGYAKTLLCDYRRTAVKAGAMRIKEWDYYLITNGRIGLALTIADNSYMGLDSVSLLDFEKRTEITKSPMSFMTRGKKHLPETSEYGDVCSSGRGYGLYFLHGGDKRTLVVQMDAFGEGGGLYGKLELTDIPAESMVIATPFGKPGHFYYNQKINCMRAKGEVFYGGERLSFEPEDSFAVLDWGRGVWTYENTWFWGSASGEADGVPFGWNVGYGFGNTSAATENMLFYAGKAHKLEHVSFNIPQKEDKKGRKSDDYLAPWTFTSSDGRFEMSFVPVLDRASCTDVKLIKSDQHQVFGHFTGKAVLDDGKVIEVKDFFGFAEKVMNKW